MSLRVIRPTETVELFFSWERAELEGSWLRDPVRARALLRKLGGTRMQALRRLAAERAAAPVWRMDDGEVLEQLARWLASGTLRVTTTLHAYPAPVADESEEAPASFRPAAVPAAVPQASPDELADVDVLVLALALKQAAKDGVPFCEECAKKKLADARAAAATEAKAAAQRTWVELQLIGEDGSPVAGERYRVTLPDGSTREGTLDGKGVARFDDLDPGTCSFAFPGLDEEAWAPV